MGFFFLPGICRVLHAAQFPGISRNYWSAAFDISIANLTQTWVLPRAAKISEEDKRNSFSSPEAIGGHYCEMSCQLKRAHSKMLQLFLVVVSLVNSKKRSLA